ncbi:MAG: RNase adapter RapZ [Gammaproteobacteria bacterium]|nr:RNase adapter RapZ [Gammaproteobacteria bacterium]
MSMIIISGLSGSGKSIALNALEDLGFYCIDNLPVGLLDAFANEIHDQHARPISKVAAGIDARNHPDQLNRFPDIIAGLRKMGIACKILFLQADDATLLKRFSETRRKHPLSDVDMPLADAIEEERRLLEPIIANADLFIDTSRTNVHQLRKLVMETQGATDTTGFSLLLRSFGYKHGIPADADFVFDVRCLPNPHWEPGLRNLTGLDKKVAEFLEQETMVQNLYDHLEQFLTTWIPCFRADNRSYLSVAIGCTGGQHRSVYIVERLKKHLDKQVGDIVIRHRELE